MIVIDASVWVSRYVTGDIHHAASRDWIEHYLERGLLVSSPALLLPEVAGAISRRVGDPDLARRAIGLLVRLPRLRLLPVDRRLTQTATTLAADLGLRGADAIYVAVAQRLQVPLLTWDGDQRIRGGRVIAAHTPESIDPRAV